MENISQEPSKENSITERLNIIRALQSSSGLFLAAAKDVTTGYDKAWLRDNFYTSLAFEWTSDYATVTRVYHAILDIFLKHENKIDLAAKERPRHTWQRIHARYHPDTFEEYWEEWGNKQNDAVGAILFKIGMLETSGHSVLRSDNDKRIVQRLVDYLASIEYWADPDNGVWEEYEEVHASSVGACVAGLKSVSTLPFITIPDGLILRGEETLRTLLPRESVSKFCDLALLSLMFPYNLLEADMERAILSNLEYHLTKERGVIRYKTDRYYNKNEIDKWSEEAEWTMGFPWLAIIYAKQGNKEKASYYLKKTEAVLWNGKLPELYYSGTTKPNDNIPLAWSESLYIVAMIEVAKMA
jgi:phosphorylase kinase alpha/beta subunit